MATLGERVVVVEEHAAASAQRLNERLAASEDQVQALQAQSARAAAAERFRARDRVQHDRERRRAREGSRGM